MSTLLCNFATVKASETVRRCLESTPDQLLKDRLWDVDLVAAEVKYHKNCYAMFQKSADVAAYSKSTTDDSDADLISQTYTHFQDSLDRGKIIKVSAFVDYYRQFDKEKRRPFNILRSMETKFAEKIQCATVESYKVFFKAGACLFDLINQETNDDRIIEQAAKMVEREILKSHSPLNTYAIDTDLIQQTIPSKLQLFLNTISPADATVKCTAIGQDIVAMVTGKITPKHLTMASTVKQLTGSKLLIEQLSKLGHCISYTELVRFETATALTELNHASVNEVIIPMNITDNSKGFIQAAADNDDFREDTKNGKTTHGTTMVLYQSIPHGQFSNRIITPRNLPKTRRTRLNVEDYGHLTKLRHIELPKQPTLPNFNEARVLQLLERNFLEPTDRSSQAKQKNLLWILTRLSPASLFNLNILPTSQQCPSWSAFNSRNTQSPDFISVVGYCPMLNASSIEQSTVYTVLTQLNQMMRKLNQEFSIITFDLAIYRVAKKVQWSRP